MPPFSLATFSSDCTPPLGHPLCGGWIEPVRGVTDPLKAVGVVLLGPDRPIVLCAVDWTGLRNDGHRLWRQALAEAANTTPERVALHCVHPHNTPFADVGAQKLIDEAKGPPSLDLAFYNSAVRASVTAVKAALTETRPITHVGIGSAKIEQVASNRRVLGPDGKVKYTRTSATKEAKARAEAEGLIDPVLRTVTFWDGDTPRASLHYYTTHPMSFYGDGQVTPDFCGLAREKRQKEHPGVHQVYFTGAAGNVTAGKYNDGSKENRKILRDRIHAGMTAAWTATKRSMLTALTWRTERVTLPPRTDSSFSVEQSRATLNDSKQTKAKRNNAAFQLAYHARANVPIDVTCLDLGPVSILHLPGEPFIEFQLDAQKLAPKKTVCVAGYGDGGPGYIPTERAFLEGGYEPTVALAKPESARLLNAAIRKLLLPDVPE